MRFAKSHEWMVFDDGRAKVGLSDFAQKTLGDLVFVNLPEVGDEVVAGEPFADVESVKAVSDVYAPVSGKVVGINEGLLDAPETINQAPYDAWLVEVETDDDGSGLMDEDAYAAFCAAGA